jgi:3'(2'), 5'-bisphosphate nucleotidase
MSEKLLNNRKALMNIVRRIAQEAGEITLEHYDDAGYFGSVTQKPDGSPVTEADQEAEALIRQKLSALFPDIPVIAEEHEQSQTSPAGHDYFWLVDPLDGTADFMKGSPDFTVNIALIHHNHPVLGVITAPVHGEIYSGFIDVDGTSEALLWREDSDTEKQIFTRKPANRGYIVISSKNRPMAGQLDEYLNDYKIDKILRRSSSLKICLIASGKADLYPRFGATSEWDSAAGHAILRASGGDIRTFSGESLRYGLQKDGFLNPEFVAAPLHFWSDGESEGEHENEAEARSEAD